MAVDRQESVAFLVFGPSGAGITTALNAFNDYGLTVVSDLTPNNFLTVFEAITEQTSQAAFSLALTPDDVSGLDSFLGEMKSLKEQYPWLKVLILDAPEPVLTERYLESGKRHPFERESLQQAVLEEKKAYNSLRALKDYSIDTSTVSAQELKQKIAKVLGKPAENPEFTVYIWSFGYKYGIPLDAELVFDMRFMTNPFYVESLRPYTAKDQCIRDYIFALPQAQEFFTRWSELVGYMLPWYRKEGKARVTVAVGCTGGQHRSVCMVEAMASYLKQTCPTYNIVVNHRESFRWPQAPVAGPSVPVGEAH